VELSTIPYAELPSWCGRPLGPSEWVTVDQEQIDLFARATGDHQWIHVDPERAAAGPFGSTIAHGYLVLSMAPALMAEVYRVDGVGMAINYGLDRVRFVSPVPVGSRLRVVLEIASVRELDRGCDVAIHTIVEREGAERPAAVIDSVRRFSPVDERG
jgi:acyl dehydratase